ncbi:MAG: hypothetical protein V3U75_13580 [Methylococcaceae bacterium]
MGERTETYKDGILVNVEDTRTVADLEGERVAPTKREIARLERQVTNRRMREAILTPEGRDWLEAQENLVSIERNKIQGE